MNTASVKKRIITAMAGLIEVEGFTNNDLILTTPIGYIMGKLISEKELDDEFSEKALLADICGKASEEYLSENPSLTSGVPGNDGYLFLKDVKIKSASSHTVTNSPFLVVFYDQIIGVSIGNIN